MAFLDNTGLSYLFGKIKELFGASLAVDGSTLTLKSKSGADLSSVTLPADETIGVHRYGVLWDANSNTCERMYNAVGMTANAHKGTFDPDLKNDFDHVYPWSGMRLCNWEKGSDTEKAKITAFKGEPGFDPDGNLGTYRPEFWYSIKAQDGGGILFIVADGKLPGYVYSPPYMLSTCFVGDDGTGGYSCKAGDVQMFNISLNTYNTRSAAQGFITEDYWCDGSEKLLQIVEFATLNSQNATGLGCTGCRHNANDVALIDESAVNHITVSAATAAYFNTHINRVVIGIGTALGNYSVARQRKLLAIEADEADSTRARLVFDGDAVDITAGNIVYTLGAINDGAPVGSASGYVGTNGVAISYYRGAAVQTGAWQWIANIMRGTDEHLYVAPTDTPQTGTISESWVDTGIVLPGAEGWIKSLGVGEGCPLVIYPTAVGENSSNPVGDYFYRPAVGAAATALLSRGRLGSGGYAGLFFSYWGCSPASSLWAWASRVLIRNPFGGDAGVATPVRPN